MIINTVTESQFRDAFLQYGRGDNFSYQGLSKLFDYLEELSDDIGEPIELDVIAICCDFSEEHFSDIVEYYDIDVTDCEDDGEIYDAVEAYLWEHSGCAIRVDDETFIYQQF